MLDKVEPYGVVQLIHRSKSFFKVNGHWLKLYNSHNAKLNKMFKVGDTLPWMHRKGEEPTAPSSKPTTQNTRFPRTRQSAHIDTFCNKEAEEQYERLVNWAVHWERKLNIPKNLATSIHDRIAFFQWGFLELDLVEINESIVKEFYGNF
ncbi:hypothetical protein AHAS_Ahas05G0048300 [Arachis hypogaea]